jgi:hypothetical protein
LGPEAYEMPAWLLPGQAEGAWSRGTTDNVPI